MHINVMKELNKNITFYEKILILVTIIVIIVSLVCEVTEEISDICGIASLTLTYYIYRKTSLIEKKLSNMDVVTAVKFASEKPEIIKWLKKILKFLKKEQNNIDVSSFSDLAMYLQRLLNYEIVLKKETINLVNKLIVLIEKKKYEKEDVNEILILLPKLIAQIDNDNEMKILVQGRIKE